MKNMNRRDFIKTVTTIAASFPLMQGKLFAQNAEAGPSIFVVHGTDVKKMLQAGIVKVGGWGAFVKKGKKVTIKPNVAWASTPEQGGNTDPVLVGESVKECLAAGALEVVLPENSCNHPRESFVMSGVDEAVKKAGGRLYKTETNEHFRKVTLPGAKILKEAEVAVDVLDTACLINMPVAKSHGSAVLTISMKNWMGSVRDRGAWHAKDLHQCIADFSTFLKPSLIIVDATRIMLTNGPRGPGELAHPHQLIFGTDPVAVDAYAATLFKKEPFDIPYIKMAHEMNVGCGDLAKIKVVNIDA